MLFADDFRRIARDGLYGRWATAVGTGFVANLFGASYFTNRSIIKNVFSGDREGISYEIIDGTIKEVMQSPFVPIVMLLLVWSVVCFIVGEPLH